MTFSARVAHTCTRAKLNRRTCIVVIAVCKGLVFTWHQCVTPNVTTFTFTSSVRHCSSSRVHLCFMFKRLVEPPTRSMPVSFLENKPRRQYILHCITKIRLGANWQRLPRHVSQRETKTATISLSCQCPFHVSSENEALPLRDSILRISSQDSRVCVRCDLN